MLVTVYEAHWVRAASDLVHGLGSGIMTVLRTDDWHATDVKIAACSDLPNAVRGADEDRRNQAQPGSLDRRFKRYLVAWMGDCRFGRRHPPRRLD